MVSTEPCYHNSINISKRVIDNMAAQINCDWTDADTEICIRAESSGLAINADTGKPLKFSELKILSTEYQKVRSNTTVDEFLKHKISSKPFGF